MDDVNLDRLIDRAVAVTVYPPTPALRDRVMSAISAPAAAPARSGRRAAWALASVGFVAMSLAILLALPASRSAIAALFGVDGIKIERLPTPAPGVTPTPLPTSSAPASIATPVSLDEAQRRIGFRPASPRGSGDPAAVYVRTYAQGESVAILDYAAYDIWEMRPREVRFGKGVPEGVTVADTAVGGRPAYWIEGGSHVAYLFGETGPIPGSERAVAVATLIWRTDFALYRLETALSQPDAIRVAETLP